MFFLLLPLPLLLTLGKGSQDNRTFLSSRLLRFMDLSPSGSTSMSEPERERSMPQNLPEGLAKGPPPGNSGVFPPTLPPGLLYGLPRKRAWDHPIRVLTPWTERSLRSPSSRPFPLRDQAGRGPAFFGAHPDEAPQGVPADTSRDPQLMQLRC